MPVARATYRGPSRVVASDTVVGQSLALSVLAPGLSGFFLDVANPAKGDRVVIQAFPQLQGETVVSAASRLAGGSLIVALREDRRHLYPLEPDSELEADDRFAILTRVGLEPRLHEPFPVSESQFTDRIRAASSRVVHRHVLLIGWSGKGPDFLEALGQQRGYTYAVDIVSRREEVDRAIPESLPKSITVRHLAGRATSIQELSQLDLVTYDRIILLATDQAPDVETADARTVANYLVVSHVLEKQRGAVAPMVELLAPANAELFREKNAEVFVTPLSMADVLAGAASTNDAAADVPEVEILQHGSPRVFDLATLAPADADFDPRVLERDLRRQKFVPLAVRRRDEYSAQLVFDRPAQTSIEPGDLLLVLDMNRSAPRTETTPAPASATRSDERV